ncbi:hypothetical protein JCM8115_003663 [Rhodotorula mucilaginosa]|uniref:Transcription and mRNA export factor SUS1 n=1 Tax=Rhodotorula mucilaginosa TaxID=5537 RepID=A0A9P6W4A3_RHOMI|nr:SAGA histone acetylase and TREX-2 complexes component [Rhodotorula mucilaginosa]
MTSSAEVQSAQQDIQAALRTRMIQSGEYSKIVEALRSKLDEAGWEDRVRDLAREKARGQEPPNLQELVNDLEPTALDMIPTDARTQVEAMVRAFVEKSIE